MEVIALILNNLHSPKPSDMLMYLESMYMEDETSNFIDYVNLTMVNKALYKFVNELGFKCFKICQEDYLLYKIIIKHGYKALFHIDDLKLCARFLQTFGYVYGDAVSETSSKILSEKHAKNYIHPKYLKLFGGNYNIWVCSSKERKVVKECEYFGIKITESTNGSFSMFNDRRSYVIYHEDHESPLGVSGQNNIEKAKILLINSPPEDIIKDHAIVGLNITINGDSAIKYLLEKSQYKHDDINDLFKTAIRLENINDVVYLLEKQPDLYIIDKCRRMPIMYSRNEVFLAILERMDLNVLYNGKNLLDYMLNYNKEITDRGGPVAWCGINEERIQMVREAFAKYQQT